VTKSAFSRESGMDDYHIMRQLFTEAMKSSTTDKRWQIHSTFSDPGRTMVTAYYHVLEGDIIKCQSFDYEDGKYKSHIFTFDQDVDRTDDCLPNSKDQGAGNGP
jgi:hypothetical protein